MKFLLLFLSVLIFHCVCVFPSFSAVTSGDKLKTGDSLCTIAFLLPFNGNKVYIRDLEKSDFYFPGESQIAVEFYQGAMLALDSLIKMGMNATILVYDVGRDSATVNEVLARPQLKSASLIVGPVNGYALKVVTEFSETEHIPMLSPLSASNLPDIPNQFYILANATLRTHCERIYDYLLQNRLAHRTILWYRNKPEDLEMVNYLNDYRMKKTEMGNPSLRIIEYNDSSRKNHVRVIDSLLLTDKNILLVPSNNESFVKSVLKQVADLREDYDIEVVGMPTWINFDLVPAESFDSANTVITSSYYLDKNSFQAVKFKTAYFNAYKMNPSDYSVRGYDELFYFGSHLLQMGSRLFLSVFPTATGLTTATSYKVVPVMRQEREVIYRENKSVFFLHRDNGGWTKMNY